MSSPPLLMHMSNAGGRRSHAAAGAMIRIDVEDLGPAFTELAAKVEAGATIELVRGGKDGLGGAGETGRRDAVAGAERGRVRA